ncbi:MAG: uroporphyrinogen-III C-methyltransferase [Planctomycetota bacterium]|nr:uroporphyrinogen-III C-methyltransferase [Planctomycetota bacterium]
MDKRLPKCSGVVYLVGAGPGDPGLLTRRGEVLLRAADVVVYDHLASPRLLDLAPPGAILVRAGKSIGHCEMPQDAINAELVAHARAGARVVRLKGGDPFIFGRGAEEAEYLRAAGVPFEVVPGVTAAVGAAAYAGIPPTHRATASAVALVTGHDDPEAEGGSSRLDWEALARFPGTLIVYMGVTHLAAICRVLIERGKPADTPAALVESGATPRQRTVAATLADLPVQVQAAGLGPPALLIVGEVVAHRAALNWFEQRPLHGRTIVVTRPAGDAFDDANTLEALGAEVLLAPLVEIRPLADPTLLDDALRSIQTYDWLVFTSANGVRAALDRLNAIGLDLRTLGRTKIAAIGPATVEALRSYRLNADIVPPDSYRSEGLADALLERVRGGRVLLARADRGRDVLRERLSLVAHVDQVAAYRNVDAATIPDAVVKALRAGKVDWITLTSSASARRLFDLVPDDVRPRLGTSTKLATISPVTSATVAELGGHVAAEARTHTAPGLIEAVLEAESKARR